ncbi:MAG: metallophosphoesterase [Clostridia bacterium]|nr:metallophosphoesterase [Clostridia bacterium]
MQTVTPRNHTYTSDKLEKEYTVVFAADLHVGSAQPFSVTEKTVKRIKEIRPDATILGGDIVDDYTTKAEMQSFFHLFSDFETPVYFIYGNHDRQGYAQYAGGVQFTRQELEDAIRENGVTVLKDEFISVAPDLMLLGREDISEGDGREDISDLINPAPEKYLIVVDHQPVRFQDNLSVGADLQLSGHTHAGQLYPLGWMYAAIGYSYGDYASEGGLLNVSAGACGWRMPFRTEAGCHYEVVTLKPD